MVCLGNRVHSVVFESVPKHCISDSFVDCEGYSISSKRFLPTVVDIKVIWIKFALAISCLTISNLPGFMDLTFQVPMQYCSLQHQILLPSPDISTTVHCFPFGSASLFFLELFFYSFPVAYWAPTYLRSSSFSVLSFCLFILFMGFSRQEYWYFIFAIKKLNRGNSHKSKLMNLTNFTTKMQWDHKEGVFSSILMY